MNPRDHVGFEDCPSCGGPATSARLDADLVEMDCPNGCGLPLGPAGTPAFADSHDGDAIAGLEMLVVLLEQAILDTAATYGLTDARRAASLVAGAWADVLREEGRSSRVVEVATEAVRGIGDRLHRRPG